MLKSALKKSVKITKPVKKVPLAKKLIEKEKSIRNLKGKKKNKDITIKKNQNIKKVIIKKKDKDIIIEKD